MEENKRLGKKATSSEDCPAQPPNPHPESQTLVFDQCTESGFVPQSAAGVLHQETPEQEDDDDGDSSISPSSWVQRQMSSGTDPRLVLGELLPKGAFVPHNVDDGLLWRFILNLLSEPKRTKLAHINTLDDVVHLLNTCTRIIVLTGAGVSVSCGIPDFRSRDGIYARLSKDYPDLPDPQAMFDIHYFRRDPRPFFKFAKEIYPGQFSPSPSHKFIQLLEKQNRLLRNYSQNIDTLEHAAGIKNVITCHGSFATATCTICRHKVDSSVIKEDIFSQRIPYCPSCPPETGIMKPDIVFFGEGLSDAFHEALAKDKDVCDLLLVMGSSLKVRPVAMIPSSIPTNVPQILINREPLKHLTFDVELLGDCDVIIGELCKRLSPEWCTEDIPRSHLREVLAPPPRGSEVNNNVGAEESNSCDCGGLSAICLEDDASGAAREDAPRPEEEETQTGEKEVPEHVPSGGSYLFFPPSRYVFEGAEVYGEDAESEDEDDSSGSPTDYSSDASPRREDERPPAPPSEDSADASPRREDAPPSGDSRPAT